MKRMIPLVLIVLFGITLIAGCGGGGNHVSDGTPEGDVKEVVAKNPEGDVKEVVANMIEAFRNLDMDTMGKYLAPDQAEKLERAKKKMKTTPKKDLDEFVEDAAKSEFSIGEVKITGSTATCEITVRKYGNQKNSTIDLKKVEGTWYFTELPPNLRYLL